MRITSGHLRGRTILAPKDRSVRPTTEKIRSAIFDILGKQAIEGAHVLDAFCGSGALALEALSRGAASALLLDISRPVVALVRANIAALDVGAYTQVLCRNALRPGAPFGAPAAVAFLDPPYSKGLIQKALPALAPFMAPECVCVLEAEKSWDAMLPAPFLETDRRIYGDSAVIFARYL